jgi:hypothetical protein
MKAPEGQKDGLPCGFMLMHFGGAIETGSIESKASRISFDPLQIAFGSSKIAVGESCNQKSPNNFCFGG